MGQLQTLQRLSISLTRTLDLVNISSGHYSALWLGKWFGMKTEYSKAKGHNERSAQSGQCITMWNSFVWAHDMTVLIVLLKIPFWWWALVPESNSPWSLFFMFFFHSSELKRYFISVIPFHSYSSTHCVSFEHSLAHDGLSCIQWYLMLNENLGWRMVNENRAATILILLHLFTFHVRQITS
jgi:hypothetical protein